MYRTQKSNLTRSVVLITIIFVLLISIGAPDQVVLSQTQRIGIQAGHWKYDSGALSCDKKVKEVDITLSVAEQSANILRGFGYQVDVLASPINYVHNYTADAFVALHTDFCAGNNTGFKVSRWKGALGTGLSGTGDASDKLTQSLWQAYGTSTGLIEDHEPGHYKGDYCFVEYYALNPIENGPICHGKYYQIRGISDSTPGAIIEMGWLSGDLIFMTSPQGQEKMAQGIANAITQFLGAGNQSSSATLLTMDVSGSMGENWQGGIKIESAKSAANEIVNMIEQESQVGGISHSLGLAIFTTGASLQQELSTDYNLARSTIANLMPMQTTNIGAGLAIANQALLQAKPGETKIIILLSDGMSNTGLSHDEIITGPVIAAANAGTCIYTVGFGDQGHLDEELLRRIANGSGCGEYYYAPDVNELEKIYIRIRHLSIGNILAEYSGTITQGQTIQAGEFDVPTGQGELAVSLHWPGSTLDLQLTDPKGRIVDQNYQTANITTYPNLIYALIEQPINGNWRLEVYGRDIPEDSTVYDAVASSRMGVLKPAATIFGPGILVVIVVLVVGGVGMYATVHRRTIAQKKPRGVILITNMASLRAISGPIAGKITAIPVTGLSIGRSSSCNLQIQDFSVSRQHARLRYAQDNWFIQDTGSKGGIFVNGQKVSASILKPGDHIKIGSTEFEFRN